MIVPFGKYKGKSVEVMAADANYVEWCKSQPGIAEKYKSIFELLGQFLGAEQDCTPEHNQLQDRFFSNASFLEKFKAASAINDSANEFVAEAPIYKAVPFGQNTSYQVVGHADLRVGSTVIELKPIIGDDYPKILRNLSLYKERFYHSGLCYSGKDRIKRIIVFADSYTGSVDITSVKEMFRRAGATLLTASDL